MEYRGPGRGVERPLLWLTLLAGASGGALALYLLWSGDFSGRVRWTAALFIAGLWLSAFAMLRERVVRPLQTLSNMLGSVRDGDFSVRVRGAGRDDALGELIMEANQLSAELREERLGAVEATTLLENVMAEVDVAIVAFDEDQRVRLINRAGAQLFGGASEGLLGAQAKGLALADCLDGAAVRTIERRFPGAAGRWGVRRSTFRQEGKPLLLLVISNLSQTLREEERTAWQRLIRVIGHELNNSLAPIKSIAQSLHDRVEKTDGDEDLATGLSIISGRAESLSRFMEAYARLARLPSPRLAPVEVAPLAGAIAGLETRLAVEVAGGPEIVVEADRDQLQQALVNLIRNATDASLETGGGVRVGWDERGAELELWVEDDGPGISNPANLFVPFFTTKPSGTGVGLVLCRQIAEAHHGSLSLESRAPPAHGCLARLRLPR